MVNNPDPTKLRIVGVGLEVVGPDSSSEPGDRLIENGIPIRFTVAQFEWLADVTGDARKDKTGKRTMLDMSAVVREAVHRLSLEGGWEQLKDALISRHSKNRPGRPPKNRVGR
jgi:hypothetical protein